MSERVLPVARAAVVVGAEISREVLRSRGSLSAVTKDDRSSVTIADFAIQAIVTHLLEEAFGRVEIIAEEDSRLLRRPEHRVELDAILALVERFWPAVTAEILLAAIDAGAREPAGNAFFVLDPIDGTKGFLRGQQYCIALAYLAEGRPLAAAIACPHLSPDSNRPIDEADAIGTLFFAAENEGAFSMPLSTLIHRADREADREADRGADRGADGKVHPRAEDEPSNWASISVPPSKRDGSSAITVCESFEPTHSRPEIIESIIRRAGFAEHASLRLDSQCKYAVVARGQADAYLRIAASVGYVERIWDHAPGVLIAREAGCAVTDIFGHNFDFSSGRALSANVGVLVATPMVHERLLTGCALCRRNSDFPAAGGADGPAPSAREPSE